MKGVLKYSEYEGVLTCATRPKDYEELLQAAKCEIVLKINELEERAGALSELFWNLESVLEAIDEKGFVTGEPQHLIYRDAADYGDLRRMKRLHEIMSNWPAIHDPPGAGGYW